MTDPYQLLEVSKTASQGEIKKSYRRLAKKYHPDFNPGNKEAEKKFKNIQHAFDLVGTPEARSKWDRGETDEQKQRQYDEYMKSQKTGRGGDRPYFYSTQDEGGRYSHSFGGDFGDEDIFESLFGGRGKHKKSGRGMQYPGEDVVYQMEVEFREAALGGEKVITLPNGKKIQVKIPAGIEGGKKLKFKGLGEQSIAGGPPGDAYIEIHVKPLPGFHRKGHDIETEVNVSFLEALLGAEIQVPTLDGNVMLTIPSGVSTGTKMRIKGKGAGAGEARGNQIVMLKVVMPKDIPPGLKDEALKMREHFNYNPRGH